jgi:hypothetical protein
LIINLDKAHEGRSEWFLIELSEYVDFFGCFSEGDEADDENNGRESH